jgi:hypothetical protein
MLTIDHKQKKKDMIILENLASEILRLKQEMGQRRPILIEFCGTPKSGKSTCIASLNIFLKRNDFKTGILTERANVCPVSKKTHPHFNTWTLCSAAAEIIKHLSLGRDKLDVIIADRAIFDALCWFEWLNTNPPKNPYLDDANYDSLKKFIMMDMWTKNLDLIYVFKVTPEKSLKREFAYLLTDKPGSIMNEDVLDGYNKSIENAIIKYRHHFKKIKEIDTSNVDPNIVGYEVTRSILNVLKDMLIEKIGFFDNEALKELKPGVNNLKILSNRELKFDNRDKVENSDKIQPVVIAVITNEDRDKVLVVKKSKDKTSNDSPERDKLLLYVGGHIRIEDKKSENFNEIFHNTLHREIQEELGESLSIKQSEPKLIYTPDTPKSRKHLAVLFVITMNLDNKKFKPTPVEFTMKTGLSKSGHVYSIPELLSLNEKYESWSKTILKEIFNVDPEPQKKLFKS